MSINFGKKYVCRFVEKNMSINLVRNMSLNKNKSEVLWFAKNW